MRILKSFIVLLFATVLTYAANDINIHPAYVGAVIYVIALLATYKFCEHKYWLVILQIFIYTILFPTFILNQIGRTVEESKTYLETLSEIWANLTIIELLINFLPLIASIATIAFIRKYITRTSKMDSANAAL